MGQQLTILRIQPYEQNVASMKLTFPRNSEAIVQRLTKATTLGWMVLNPSAEPEGPEGVPVPLVIAADAAADPGLHGWKLGEDGKETRGIAILFGKSKSGGMTDCPVDRDWVNERIRWTSPESPEERDQRLVETIEIMNPDLREIVRSGVERSPISDAWLVLGTAEERQALDKLGLLRPSKRPMLLNGFGVEVRDTLLKQAIQ